ncbi:hypothetical protein [Kitasatospora sp. A2-31]|nr:hypothetical protein [Kitasatospora sp. A2-31]MCG6495532.1 hypothetical protein [Kitasatospora sp. A2-31]
MSSILTSELAGRLLWWLLFATSLLAGRRRLPTGTSTPSTEKDHDRAHRP